MKRHPSPRQRLTPPAPWDKLRPEITNTTETPCGKEIVSYAGGVTAAASG
jgi:hypothetical protein